MMIGIICAMEQEVTLIRDRLNYSISHLQGGCEIFTGQLHGIEVVLVKSGIGKVFAALGTTLLLDRFKPELIINTGSAGSLVTTLHIGDVVVSNEVCYHDVDITAFGYEPGQIAQCPTSFSADPSLISLAEEVTNRLNMHVIRGLIVSGDAFINGAEELSRIRQTFPEAVAVEMESAAVAHVCYQFAVPFIVVRVISDIADQASHLNFKEFLSIASKNFSRLVEEMVKTLASQ